MKSQSTLPVLVAALWIAGCGAPATPAEEPSAAEAASPAAPAVAPPAESPAESPATARPHRFRPPTPRTTAREPLRPDSAPLRAMFEPCPDPPVWGDVPRNERMGCPGVTACTSWIGHQGGSTGWYGV